MAEEIELTFRIVSQNPQGVFLDIASRHSIARYRLITRGSFEIQDTYLDTAKFDLGKSNYALRLRRQSNTVLLALKGREQVTPWGGISRLEIEGPWSGEILRQIEQELGLNFRDPKALGDDNPLETLCAMGFMVIQSRKTNRTLFDVFFQSEDKAFSEIALDRVCYEVEGKGCLHYEIEVEAKAEDRQGRLSDFAGCLQQAFPGLLQPWEHNKLITGFALEELMHQGELLQAHDEENMLSLTSYDKIDAWIRQKKGRG
jgi:inorganic triphosphatase YgiF